MLLFPPTGSAMDEASQQYKVIDVAPLLQTRYAILSGKLASRKLGPAILVLLLERLTRLLLHTVLYVDNVPWVINWLSSLSLSEFNGYRKTSPIETSHLLKVFFYWAIVFFYLHASRYAAIDLSFAQTKLMSQKLLQIKYRIKLHLFLDGHKEINFELSVVAYYVTIIFTENTASSDSGGKVEKRWWSLEEKQIKNAQKYTKRFYCFWPPEKSARSN